MQHRDFRSNPKLGAARTNRLLGVIAFSVAVALTSVVLNAASPRELPTKWQVPPGDWLEQETVRATANGPAIRMDTKRRDVVPVALEIF